TLFKGPQRRTAHELATESDRLGGQFDAYTAHEMTGFAAKVVDTEMPRAFDLLADMVVNPRFDEDDLMKAQKVIIEEMKMIEDTPDELLTDLFHAAYFPDHSLGRPIEGTEKTVSTFDRSTTADFHARNFVPRNLVVAAAGNVVNNELVEMAKRTFGAEANTFSDVGMFTIYAGTSPAQMDQVFDLSLHELRRIVREPVAEDELELAKEQSISSVLLSLESSSTRVGALARQEIIHGRRISPDAIIASIERVTREDVQRLAQTCFTTPALALGALGNLNGFSVDRSRLEI